MKSSWINYLAILTLFILVGVVAINLTLLMRPPKKEPVIDYNDVRGMAIEKDGFLYTLNFKQQNGVVKALNHPEKSKAPLPVSFTRLIIYRFNAPELVYTAHELAQNVPLINLLDNTYDTYAETATDPEYYSH